MLIPVDEQILKQFSRHQLRSFAEMLGVRQGRNKDDTIKNLIDHDPNMALRVKSAEVVSGESVLTVTDHGDKTVYRSWSQEEGWKTINKKVRR